jgi:hypothetical protein
LASPYFDRKNKMLAIKTLREKSGRFFYFRSFFLSQTGEDYHA